VTAATTHRTESARVQTPMFGAVAAARGLPFLDRRVRDGVNDNIRERNSSMKNRKREFCTLTNLYTKRQRIAELARTKRGVAFHLRNFLDRFDFDMSRHPNTPFARTSRPLTFKGCNGRACWTGIAFHSTDGKLCGRRVARLYRAGHLFACHRGRR
jgi:hypothetical protein